MQVIKEVREDGHILVDFSNGVRVTVHKCGELDFEDIESGEFITGDDERFNESLELVAELYSEEVDS